MISVLPSANDRAPCTKTRTSRATGSSASTARAGQPMSSSGPPAATTRPGRSSDSRPAAVTPTRDPTPKSIRTTGIHSSPSPAVSVTTGARKVKPPKVAAFTSAPSPMTRISRGRLSCASSDRRAGPTGSSCCAGRAGIPLRMPMAAGRQRTSDGPERGPPSEQRAEYGSPGDAGDGGQRRARQQHSEGPALLVGRDQRAGRRQRDREESGVGERCDHPGGDQYGKAGRGSAHDVGCQEGEDEPEKAGPDGPGAGERGHERGTDDHSDREGRGEQGRRSDGHVEVRGDVRQETGEHEF